jgi:glycosyltransferase involved in cell wall biosynthesis
MSQKRKKLKRPSQAHRVEFPTEESLRKDYDRACQLADQGRTDQARKLYQSLDKSVNSEKLRALVGNDLAVLAFMGGDREQALQKFHHALALDPECEPALTNLALVNAESSPTKPELEATNHTTESATGEARIRIAILSFLFNWPSTGGGIVHTVELAQFLIRAGYDVRHFYARHLAWGIGKVESPVPFPSVALDFDESNWNVLEIQAQFRRAVAEFDPDHVIITDSWNSKPILAEAVRGYPYILRFQAMECLCPLNNVRLLADKEVGFRQCTRNQLATPEACNQCLVERGQKSGSLHQAERTLCGVGTPEYHELLMRSLREAEAVLVVNPLHEAMISPYAECVRVVTAGMAPARFPGKPDVQPPKEKMCLLFAGLVEETIKGFEVLHEACARLWKSRHDFELVATGDPPGRLDDFTRFIGWQTQEDLPRHLYAADILVMPTIAQEALGRTAVEAMAAGIPVVASRLGGLPFTVVDGATGLLFNPGNPEDLARKINTLLDDPDLRKRLGQAGRHRFEEHYAWPVIIERHYRPLLGPRKRSLAPKSR